MPRALSVNSEQLKLRMTKDLEGLLALGAVAFLSLVPSPLSAAENSRSFAPALQHWQELLTQADKNRVSGNDSAAEKNLQNALHLAATTFGTNHPTYSETARSLGQFYATRHDTAMSKKFYRLELDSLSAVTDNFPNKIEPLFQLGRFAINDGDLKQGRSLISEAMRIHERFGQVSKELPEHDHIATELLFIELVEGQFKEALNIMSSLMRNHHGRWQELMILCHLCLNQYQEADALAKQIGEELPTETEAQLIDRIVGGRFAEYCVLTRKSVELMCSRFAVIDQSAARRELTWLYWLVDQAAGDGRVKDTAVYFEKATRLMERFGSADDIAGVMEKRADVFFRYGQPESGIVECKRMLEFLKKTGRTQSQKYGDALIRLAQAYQISAPALCLRQLGDADQWMETTKCSSAAYRNVQRARSMNIRACFHLRKNELTPAKKYLAQSSQYYARANLPFVKEERLQPLRALALVKMQENQPAPAVALLNSVIKQTKDKLLLCTALRERAVCYTTLNNQDSAIQDCQQAAKLLPPDETSLLKREILIVLANAYTKSKKFDKAKEAIELATTYASQLQAREPSAEAQSAIALCWRIKGLLLEDMQLPVDAEQALHKSICIYRQAGNSKLTADTEKLLSDLHLRIARQTQKNYK